ncbi:MAG: hypothetical protein MZV64_35165 [Ignavibacteriales bacterium]|nr:hypothetical protein [Ignavibacteriales bacterium]
MDLAVKQVEAGAKAVDINLGPRKKDWAEVFPWIVETVETVVDVPLSHRHNQRRRDGSGAEEDHEGPADPQLDLGGAGAPGENPAAGEEIQRARSSR